VYSGAPPENHEGPDETEDYRQNWTKHSFAPVLANARGLHVSGRTIQNYLVDLERQKLVKLERIRKGQGHSQLVKPIITFDGLT
jgi:hypothetical protein